MCRDCPTKPKPPRNRSDSGGWEWYHDALKEYNEARNRLHGRSFPENNGTVDGKPAYVKQRGNRTEAYSGPGNREKIVTNDGINASYIRDASGYVSLNDQRKDPYEGYDQD